MAINKIPVKAFTAGDLALDTFTATAGQTAVTLSIGATNNSVIVTVNDVLQVPPTDYSVNGTTLTFTSALALNDSIVVRILSRPSTFGTVEDGAISSAKLANGAIESKLGYTPVSPTQLSTSVSTAVSDLVASAPSTLNTLNEIATALGNDANFATTITNTLALKSNITTTVTKDSSTGAATLPVGTTAQRPTGTSGMVRMNSTTGYPEWYSTVLNTWVNMADAPYAVEYIIVAGGGAGGSDRGGGGGAGGYLTGSTVVSFGTQYPIIIGAGGAGGANVFSNGNNTTALGFTAIAGGGGANNYGQIQYAGGNGGSGGGASNQGTSTPGSGTVGQGNRGGYSGSTISTTAGGGGGGAGAVGGDASSGNNGGNGGIGLADTWTGSSRYLAGGGGGAGGSGSAGSGGTGGGGAGSRGDTSGTAGSGTSNTGGGGGGTTGGGTGVSGSGGSGIVVIRYPGAQRGSGGTVTSSGGYTLHTFTSSSATFTA